MAWHTSHRGPVYFPDLATAGPSEPGAIVAGGSSQLPVGPRDLIDVNDVEKSETTSQPSARQVPSAFESLNPFKKETSAPSHHSLSSRGPDDYGVNDGARVGTGGRTTDLRKEGRVFDSQNRNADSTSFNRSNG